MAKRILLFLLVIFTIFSVGITFADIVTPGVHRVDRCVKIVNPQGISGYKLVWRIFNYSPRDGNSSKTYSVYDVKENECLPNREIELYLVDENIDTSALTDLSLEDFENSIGKYIKMNGIDTKSVKLDNLNPVTKENVTYKTVEHGSGYKLKFVKKSVAVDSDNLKIIKEMLGVGSANLEGEVLYGSPFPFSIIVGIISWFLTILIETIILFLMAKLFRKKDQIPNRRLFLIGVLASTVTLPLLRFVVPLFIGYGVKYIIIGELLVTFIEVFILKYGLKISRGKAILASIICNLCSFLIGEVINFFLLPF